MRTPLFDYSTKTSEWLKALRQKLHLFVNEETRAKVLASIEAELKKRGE